jgi:DNA-3-methyladenine glycosylase I
VSVDDGRIRCSWCGVDEFYVRYHDLEWGVPERRDNALFELLTLEGAQAGLSWITVLRRREGYRRAFKKFNPSVVARFDEANVDAIMGDEGVIRHRQKIASVITNAQAVLDAQREHGSFSEYVWELAALDEESAANGVVMSKRLRKDGFKFVGPTICWSFMQASGMVNDHAPECFRFEEIETLHADR